MRLQKQLLTTLNWVLSCLHSRLLMLMLILMNNKVCKMRIFLFSLTSFTFCQLFWFCKFSHIRIWFVLIMHIHTNVCVYAHSIIRALHLPPNFFNHSRNAYACKYVCMYIDICTYIYLCVHWLHLPPLSFR